nr:HAD family hydrolase [Thermoanaerobacterales bacterium]
MRGAARRLRHHHRAGVPRRRARRPGGDGGGHRDQRPLRRRVPAGPRGRRRLPPLAARGAAGVALDRHPRRLARRPRHAALRRRGLRRRGRGAVVSGPRRLVVVDIDDTLYPERDYVRSGFAAVGAWARDELGVDGLGERAWAAFEAGVRRTIFDEVLAAAGLEPTPELVGRMVEVYRTHRPDIALLDDARAWLDAVPDDVVVAAVTDGPLASQRAKAEALDLRRWVATIVFTAELGPGRGKPHPAAFERLERELGLAGPCCAYVADNPAKDFVAPRRLGWRTVRVRRPEGLHARVPSGDDVDVEITTLAELDAALGPAPAPARRAAP